MSFDVYPQDRVIEDYVEIGYDYFRLHMKYVSENNIAGIRVLHSLFKNRELPLESRAKVVVEESIPVATTTENQPPAKPTLTFLEIIAAQKAAKENK